MRRLVLGTVILVGVAVSVPAAAELAVGPEVPFTAGELEAALVPRGIAVPDGTIALVTATTVELTTAAGRQHVELGPARGAAAARLVALHLVEPGGAVDLPAPAPDVVATAAPVPSPRRWQLSLVAGGGRGVQAVDFGLIAVRADVLRARGRWRYGASLGWLHGLAEAADPTRPVTADLGILRIGGGLAVGRFEVLAGPALVVHRVTGTSGAGWGAGGAVRARLLEIDRWSVVASGDLDVLGHRVAVALDGAQFVATPRVAFTGAIGVRWEGP